jgi:PAS domain S-box-containing protein
MLVAVSAVASATCGVITLYWAGYIPLSGLAENWKTWWLGDVTGLMVVTPLILSFLEKKRQSSVKVRRPLIFANIGLLILIGFGIFGGLLSDHIARDILYVTVIYLIWSAISFRFRFVTMAIAFLSGMAIWGTLRGVGPYCVMSIEHSIFDLQLFISLYALTGLTLAGLVSRRREVLMDLKNMKFALDQSAIVAVTDRNGLIEKVNDKFCEISKFSREEILCRVPPLSDSENQLKLLYINLLQQKKPGYIWRGEVSCRAKDGNLFWTDTTIVPFLDENNRPRQYLSICFDITDRKQANQQSRRLFQAVEKTTDIVFITDREGRIEYVNPAFETITGFGSDEVVGQTPRIMKSGKQGPEHYKKLWSTILDGDVHRSTVINSKKNGEYFHAEQTITPVKNKDGEITNFVSVLKDITELLEKKEQEVAMRLARQVQQSYYQATASVRGYDIAGFACPADETGGDYFDFIELSDGSLALAIGDVSGHGISAAMIMAETRAYLRSYAGICCDVGSLLTNVNRALAQNLEPDRFVTLLVVCLDPVNRKVTFSGAGHEPGYLLNASGGIISEFESCGPPLGLCPDRSYSSSEPVSLEKDQSILLLTDGITDTPLSDGYAFGARQAIKYFNTHRDKPSRQIAEGLCNAVEAYAADHKLQDDITSVVLKVL